MAYLESGYVRKVFDPQLGYVSSFIIDGRYIYADRVRIISTYTCSTYFACMYVLCVCTLLLVSKYVATTFKFNSIFSK